MTSRGRWLLIAFTALLATAAGAFLARTQRPVPANVEPDVYRRLLATQLVDTSGQRQPLAQWQGNVLVVNFWATWCPPCRKEMPALTRLQQKHAGNKVQIVGIALDSAANVMEYAIKNPAGYPLLIGDQNTSELTRTMGNSQLALPYTAVFDRDGHVRMTRLGLVSESELDALLTEIARL